MDKGFQEQMKKGPMIGFPIVGSAGGCYLMGLFMMWIPANWPLKFVPWRLLESTFVKAKSCYFRADYEVRGVCTGRISGECDRAN